MRLFGLEITRRKAAPPEGLSSASGWGGGWGNGSGGWWSLIREPFSGAWQRNEEVRVDTGLTNATLFRCVALIASDIAKMCLRLMQQDAQGIWNETASGAFTPVLRKPNRYQTTIQFVAEWVISKLLHGNTYVLKERDNRNVVVALYVLNPQRVRPLIGPDGSIYYELQGDNLSGLQTAVTLPASEVIHDRMNTIFHPLIGVSPVYACGLAAMQGVEMQRNSTRFFKNAARPGGMLTAPAKINQETADRLKASWSENYSGENIGKIAVAGDGLTFVPMVMSAVDAQLIEQLKWTSENICSAFGVPAYMVGVGPAPLNNNVEALSQQYFGQCLQIHVESIEACLDDGLGLGPEFYNNYGVEFDLDDLLRMDTATMIKSLSEGVLGGLFKPDEARRRLNLSPVTGGNAVYLQQQNYSLEALAKRDASDDPFGKAANPAPANDPQLALPAPAPQKAAIDALRLLRAFDGELERDAA